MTKEELDELKAQAVIRIFTSRSEVESFFDYASLHWRYTPENILALYMQDQKATCVAGRKAFEHLGYQLKDAEKPIHIYSTVITCKDMTMPNDENEIEKGLFGTDRRFKQEQQFCIDYTPVPVYDIRQFDGVKEGHIVRPDMDRLCAESEIPIMEVDRFPMGYDYSESVYDEDEGKIWLLRSVRGDARISAILESYIQYLFVGASRICAAFSVEDIAYLKVIKSPQNAMLLIKYCIEKHYGIKSTVSNVGIILENVSREYTKSEDREYFLYQVCYFVQRIIQKIDGDTLTVEETNVLNCLMVSDEVKAIEAIQLRFDEQAGPDEAVKDSVDRILNRLTRWVSDKMRAEIFDLRCQKELFSYPEVRLCGSNK